MDDTCSCHEGSGESARKSGAPVASGAPLMTPELTVDEITRRWPGARGVLAELGINHCCGAHLTLAQAAAAAGVPAERLLRVLDRAVRGTA